LSLTSFLMIGRTKSIFDLDSILLISANMSISCREFRWTYLENTYSKNCYTYKKGMGKRRGGTKRSHTPPSSYTRIIVGSPTGAHGLRFLPNGRVGRDDDLLFIDVFFVGFITKPEKSKFQIIKPVKFCFVELDRSSFVLLGEETSSRFSMAYLDGSGISVCHALLLQGDVALM